MEFGKGKRVDVKRDLCRAEGLLPQSARQEQRGAKKRKERAAVAEQELLDRAHDVCDRAEVLGLQNGRPDMTETVSRNGEPADGEEHHDEDGQA